MIAPATFSLFVRPAVARPWYVALGVQRVVELLETFRYGPDELRYLQGIGVEQHALAWLEAFEPSGELWAVAEGTLVLAQEPILEFTGPLPVAQLLETAVVNLVQLPTAVATKAARCALAAGGRQLADFGFRRAHGLETGVEASLAASIGGGFVTSNVEAGRRHGIPVTGTMAHSYVQAFTDEREAFQAFGDDQPEQVVLLVDTYDTVEGVRRAITVAGQLGGAGRRLHGIRLDSGDLGELSAKARRLLDDAGLQDVQIIASGGLDEFRIHELVSAGAPIDAFGVGSALATSEDYPALDIVYKLVEYDGRPVAKFSGAKSTWPGRKQVFRTENGLEEDMLSVREATEHGHGILKLAWRNGEALHPFDAGAVRAHVMDQLAQLPPSWKLPPYPPAAPVPAIGRSLETLSAQVRASAFMEES